MSDLTRTLQAGAGTARILHMSRYLSRYRLFGGSRHGRAAAMRHRIERLLVQANPSGCGIEYEKLHAAFGRAFRVVLKHEQKIKVNCMRAEHSQTLNTNTQGPLHLCASAPQRRPPEFPAGLGARAPAAAVRGAGGESCPRADYVVLNVHTVLYRSG